MNRPLARVALLVLVLLAAATAVAADKVELRLRLDEGKTYIMTMTAKQAITQTFMGQEMAIDQTIQFAISFKSTKVDADGNTTVDVKYDSVAFEQDGPMGWIEYDSADPPDEIPMMARGFAGLVGRGFTMTVSPEGKVTDVKGVDKLFEEIVESMELPEGPMLDQMKESLKQQFGDEAMKQQMQQMLATLPEKPVGVGDSWSAESNLTGMLAMVIKNTWKVTSIKDGIVTLDGESTIEPAKDGEPMKMGPMSMKIDLTGSQKGTMELDEHSGFPLKAAINQDISGTVTTSQPGSDEEMSIPMTIKSTITLEGKIGAGDAEAPDDVVDITEDAE
jgi:hypothetical protein